MQNLQKKLEDYDDGNVLDFICEPNGDTMDVRFEEEKSSLSQKNTIMQFNKELSFVLENYKGTSAEGKVEYLISLLLSVRGFKGVEAIEQKVNFLLKKQGLSEEEIEKKLIAEKHTTNKDIQNDMNELTEKLNRDIEVLISEKAANIYMISLLSGWLQGITAAEEAFAGKKGDSNFLESVIQEQMKKGYQYIITNNPTDKDLAFVGQYAPNLLN